jgi:adenylyltransferase/sulfurtransferase
METLPGWGRYSRQIVIPRWGERGQEKLQKATVFLAGAGGLGSPAALYLAAAGVGRLMICDHGSVELSNLNRQVLYCETDLGSPKAETAARRLGVINSGIQVVPLSEEIDRSSIARLTGGAGILIDCLDNFPARRALNEYAVASRTPLIHAAVEGLYGQITFLHPPRTPCLSCIFPEDPTTEGMVPVAGITPGILGTMEATEAIKHLTGIGEVLENRLALWDGESPGFEIVKIEKNPACPVCSDR